MAFGGFLIKFNGKEDIRCAEATFGFDGWRYKTNGTDWAPLPKGIKTITHKDRSTSLKRIYQKTHQVIISKNKGLFLLGIEVVIME